MKMDQTQSTKRDKILLTAQRLFSRFGVRKTTVDEIIRLTSIAKGTFYKYFPDKEALFLEVVEKESHSLVFSIQEAVAQASTSTEKMQAYLLTKVRMITKLVNFYQVTREVVDEYWPQIEGIREKYYKEEQRIIFEMLENGIAEEELDITNPELTAYAIVIAVKGLESTWMLEASPMELEKGVDLLLDVLFKGISKKN